MHLDAIREFICVTDSLIKWIKSDWKNIISLKKWDAWKLSILLLFFAMFSTLRTKEYEEGEKSIWHFVISSQFFFFKKKKCQSNFIKLFPTETLDHEIQDA